MKKPLIKNIDVFFLSLCLFASGCQQANSPVNAQKNLQDRATTLIEQDHNDEAIAIMQADLDVHPDSDTDRQILASAYANRSGIQIQDYYGFTISYNSLISQANDVSSSEESTDLATILPGLTAAQKQLLQPLLQDLDLILKMSNRIAQIPSVSESQVNDLTTAALVLEPANSPGAHLYRVILEVILLKFDFTQTAQSVTAVIAGTDCQNRVSTLSQQLQASLQLVDQVLYDFSLAFPSNAASVLEFQNKVSAVLNSLPDDVKTVEPLICPGT